MADRPRELSRPDIDRIIILAWEHRTSFAATAQQDELSSGESIWLMPQAIQASSFKMRPAAHTRSCDPTRGQVVANRSGQRSSRLPSQVTATLVDSLMDISNLP